MTGRTLEDRMRAFSALYPIPIVVSAMLVFSMGCLSLATIVADPLRWVFAAIGVMMVLIASFLFVYVVVYKSDLLRVERETITVGWVDRTRGAGQS